MRPRRARATSSASTRRSRSTCRTDRRVPGQGRQHAGSALTQMDPRGDESVSVRAGARHVVCPARRGLASLFVLATLIASVPTARPPEHAAPFAPQTLEETGLTSMFIAELTLKLLYQKGQSSGADLANSLCLPMKILEPVLDGLKAEHQIEVKGGSGVSAATYIHALSSIGAGRA